MPGDPELHLCPAGCTHALEQYALRPTPEFTRPISHRSLKTPMRDLCRPAQRGLLVSQLAMKGSDDWEHVHSARKPSRRLWRYMYGGTCMAQAYVLWHAPIARTATQAPNACTKCVFCAPCLSCLQVHVQDAPRAPRHIMTGEVQGSTLVVLVGLVMLGAAAALMQS